jgi:hypothetical protein
MESRDDVRAKRQKAANIRWNKNKDANAEHDVMHEECISNAIKERKERKEKNNIYTPEFEVFYSEYPRPEDKRRSFNNWKACLKSYTVDQLMTACRNYKKAKAGKQIEFIKSSANFLGKEKPFEDFLNTKTPESKYIDRTGYEPR